MEEIINPYRVLRVVEALSAQLQKRKAKGQ